MGRDGRLVVGVAVEHAWVPAEDLVAEPFQGDEADGAGGLGITVGANQLGPEQFPQRLVAQPGAPLDGAEDRRGWEAIAVGTVGGR
jgi:hypothetical protein